MFILEVIPEPATYSVVTARDRDVVDADLVVEHVYAAGTAKVRDLQRASVDSLPTELPGELALP